MEHVVIRSDRDVISFVDAHPATHRTWLVVLVALGGIFVDAYDFASLGVGVTQLRAQFHLSAFELGSVTATMAIGAFVGALLGGRLTDRVGRYKMFLVNLLLLVVAAIGAALAVNLTMLLFFRFLMGAGVGLDFPVALSFIAEYVNARSKGPNVNRWQGMWYVAATCTGLVILPFYFAGFGEHLWRIAIGFGAVPAFAILLLRGRLMDESPIWAAQNVGLDEAARVMRRMYGAEVRVEPGPPKLRPAASGFGVLFRPEYRARTALASLVCATQSLEYYSVGFNLPSITQSVFGHSLLYGILGAAVFNLFGIIGGFGGASVTTRFGTRRLAIAGYCVVIASLLLIGLFGRAFGPVATGALLGLFIFGHSFGPGAQGATIATLSYPTSVRGTGAGWGQAASRVGSVIGFYFFPLVIAAVGLNVTMLILIAAPALGLLACLAIAWEPIGKALEVDPESAGAASAMPSVPTLPGRAYRKS